MVSVSVLPLVPSCPLTRADAVDQSDSQVGDSTLSTPRLRGATSFFPPFVEDVLVPVPPGPDLQSSPCPELPDRELTTGSRPTGFFSLAPSQSYSRTRES